MILLLLCNVVVKRLFIHIFKFISEDSESIVRTAIFLIKNFINIPIANVVPMHS